MARKTMTTLESLGLALQQIDDAQDALSEARAAATRLLADAVCEHLNATGETQTAFAKRHTVSKGHVTDIVHGRRFSGFVARALIARAARVVEVADG